MGGLPFCRTKRHQLLTAVGAILSAVASACTKSAPLATTPPAPTPPEATSPILTSPGWQDYVTPTFISASGVSRTTIDYAWEEWGERKLGVTNRAHASALAVQPCLVHTTRADRRSDTQHTIRPGGCL
jgi:hypothetical protein